MLGGLEDWSEGPTVYPYFIEGKGKAVEFQSLLWTVDRSRGSAIDDTVSALRPVFYLSLLTEVSVGSVSALWPITVYLKVLLFRLGIRADELEGSIDPLGIELPSLPFARYFVL